MPAATREEIAALNALRAMENRPPLSAHEIEALSYDPPAPQAADRTMTEAEALAYLGSVAGPGPASDVSALAATPAPASRPAPATAAAPAPGGNLVDPAALAAAGVGGPLTSAEASLLAEISAEYVADGEPAMTPAKALAIVVQRRQRAA